MHTDMTTVTIQSKNKLFQMKLKPNELFGWLNTYFNKKTVTGLKKNKNREEKKIETSNSKQILLDVASSAI